MLLQRDISQYRQFAKQITKSSVFMEVAEEGDPEALFLLAQAYRLSEDYSTWRKYLLDSVARGHKPAILAVLSTPSGSEEGWYQALIEKLEPFVETGNWFVLDALAEIRARLRHRELRQEIRKREFDQTLSPRDYMAEQVRASKMSEGRLAAFEACYVAADSGEIAAQERLASMYRHGLGVDEGVQASVAWLKRSAEAGAVNSQRELSTAYEHAIGIEKDIERSIYWLERAAKQGDSTALFELAIRYLRGEGVQKDLQKAIDLLRKAAWEGNSKAFANLNLAAAHQMTKADPDLAGESLLGEYGARIDAGLKDFIKDQLRQGADSGDTDLCYQFAHFNQREIERGFDDRTTEEENIELLERAAKQGHADAQYHLAEILSSRDVDQIYETGLRSALKRAFRRLGGTNDAMRWYLAAAEQGHVRAQFNLGYRFTNRYLLDGPVRAKSGLMWLERAALSAHVPAMMHLGAIYAEGKLVRRDLGKTTNWYRKAASLGDDQANFIMGWFCHSGTGVAKDLQAAKSYFEASNDGSAKLMLQEYYGIEECAVDRSRRSADPAYAFYSLGFRFFDDANFPADIEESAIWFKKAAHMEQAASQYFLALIHADYDYSGHDPEASLEWLRLAADQGYKPAVDLLKDKR